MEKALENLQKAVPVENVTVDGAVEISFDDQKYPNNGHVSAADWEHLKKQCVKCQALSFVNCGLKKITAAEEVNDKLEVLDVSCNEEFDGDLSFVEKFPNLVSLTLAEAPLMKSIDQLKPLESLKDLKILELDEAEQFGFKDDEEFREAVMKMLPQVAGFNGLDKAGMPLTEMEEEAFLNELDFEDDDEDEEEEFDDDDDEPDSKRLKEGDEPENEEEA